ncbi:MAG: DUF1573 domain-containing protein [Flavobacteriales bacterium]|nr:hypothetical protein [Flavobacteriales bacterium]MCC6578577.1 DUF1573 domain-containing protein [Flavobacteriales bacterium]NUQ15829.1 DUF1573 domain-containing protein [Flavobacteriales bacterium]
MDTRAHCRIRCTPGASLARAGRSWLLLAPLALLGACRITDHSERGPEDVDPTALDGRISGSGEAEGPLAVMTFDSTLLHLGRIAQGAVVERTFSFRNTGQGQLVIADVRGSCGCTVGKDWPRQPIAPGGSGTITVSFDSEGREGMQEKTVSVVANTRPPTTILTIQGEVLTPLPNP